MGCYIFCKTVTHQYWNVVTTPLIPNVDPDSFHNFAIVNDVLNDVEYFTSLDFLEENSGKKASYRKLARKFEEDGFYGGFGKVVVGSNSFPTDLVKNKINPNNPSDVIIIESDITPLDYEKWAIAYITSIFEYDEATATAVIDGITYSFDFTTLDSETNTIEYKNTDTLITTTLDLPVEPIGDSLWAKYYLSSDPSQKHYVWTYDISTDRYSDLSLYTQVPDTDPAVFKIFPIIPIRVNNVNYPDITTHSDYSEYVEMMGLDPQSISDSIAEQTDLDKLDNVVIYNGVNLQDGDKHSLRYCSDFVKKLAELNDAYPTTIYDDLDAILHKRATAAYTNSTATALNPSINTEALDSLGIELICDFADFDYTIKYAGVNRFTVHNDALESSAAYVNLLAIRNSILNTPTEEYGIANGAYKYGSVVSYGMDHVLTTLAIAWEGPFLPTKIKQITGEFDAPSRFIPNNIITYFAVNADGDMDCYTLVNPTASYIVKDTQSGQTKVVYVDLTSTDGDLYFPLDWRIIENYPNQVVTSLYSSSLYMINYYAYWEQEEVWDWGFLTIVIVVVTFIVCPTCAAEMFVALTDTLVAAGMTVATAQAVVTVLLVASTGVFGEDAASFASIALFVISFNPSTFVLGFNKQTIQIGTFVGDLMNRTKMEYIREEFEQIVSAYNEFKEELEKVLDALQEIMEDIGYYKNLETRGYAKKSLLGYKKVDELNVMSAKAYLQQNKDSVKLSNYYDTIYDYIYI